MSQCLDIISSLAREIAAQLEAIGFPGLPEVLYPNSDGGWSFWWGREVMHGGSIWLTIEPLEDDPEEIEIWVTADNSRDRKCLDCFFDKGQLGQLVLTLDSVRQVIKTQSKPDEQ